jgi:hypothetical protein
MQIPLFSIRDQNGRVEYELSLLSQTQTQETTSVALSAVNEKVAQKIPSPYLGLVHRNQYIQVFGFYSCTGWTLLVGFENGPYNGDEVCYSSFLVLIYVGCALDI